MSLDDLTLLRTATEHGRALQAREYTAEELAQACIARAKRCENLGAFLSLDEKQVLSQARASDERRQQGKTLGPLDGIPVAVKDNICVEGSPTTCASRILENFIAPYDATVIAKLRAAGAVLFGRANMDEFAMGSSTENSAFQNARNPWDDARVPGGSSGGSAVAVAAGITPLALGSDTGGSIRQPAAFCGVVGMKPTYGRVSRYGLVAYASSLDQIGPFARSVDDAALLLSAISGGDSRDSTSRPEEKGDSVAAAIASLKDADWKQLRVGVMLPDDAASRKVYDPAVLAQTEAAVDFLKSKGATIVPVRSKLEKYLIPIYYILATAEASSNLSRYDGVRYGVRADEPKDLMDLYVRSRSQGFGDEVKRRILLGTFVLSSGYYDAYYKSAQKARRLIQKEYAGFFEKVDVILSPTSPSTAFKLGDRTGDPLAMYQSDILTIAANLTGTPAISIAGGMDEQGLPVGLQLVAAQQQENQLLRVAAGLSAAPGFTPDYARVVAGKTASAAPKQTSVKPSSTGAAKPAEKSAKKAAAKKSAKKSAAKPAKKSAKKAAAKKTAKKVAKKAAKKSAKKVAKKAAKKTAKKTVKKAAAKKTAKKIAKKTAKKVTKKTAKKTAKKPIKKTSKKVAKKKKR